MYRLQRLSAALLLGVGLAGLAACGGRPLLPPAGGSSAGDNLPAFSEPRSLDSGPYLDEFIPGRTGTWVLEADELGSTAIVNEQLVITVAAPNTIQYTTLSDYTFDDFVLEVDTWQRSGPLDSSYGVLFRMADGQQFYRFEINGNGHYLVERRGADGVWTRLIPDWTPSAAINPGLNVANRLKVIAAGSDLTFYANDILLIQLSDAAFSAGAIALDAGTFAGNDLQVSFDNLIVAGDSS
jgi:hypothetical protein